MKAIMVMFDSLNRHMLPPYGCDWVKAPNFARLAERTVTFDKSYVGSMPCMPARREIHTGRYNFLHRSWGPVEPFDHSMPEILKNNGVHSHLVTDHYHYFEDGGCTYHNRYSTWDFYRGHEGDYWKADLTGKSARPESVLCERDNRSGQQDWINRAYMPTEDDQPQAKTFAAGLEFLETNQAQDNWFLQIETFDPHEPFFTQEHFKELYPHDYDGPHFDWPPYRAVEESADEVEHMRYENAALVSMCDKYMGKVIDKMDELNLWEDTLLIVCTDHGFLLGEHDNWAKCHVPFFEEVAHTPLFIWDPRCGRKGERCDALVQTIDWAPTILEYFGLDIPPEMMGKSLRDAVASNQPVHDAVIFGMHGGHVNLTDGKHVYMRAPAAPENAPLYNYTLMPTNMNALIEADAFAGTTMAEPFEFTRGCPTMKIKTDGAARNRWSKLAEWGTLLYDVEADPQQQTPLQDTALHTRMEALLIEQMKNAEAPPEQYERLGLKGGA